MIKEDLLTVFYLLLFNFLIYRFKKLQFRNFKPFVTHIIFNLKFAVGILIWVIYTFYYGDLRHNDVHKFYQDALSLNNLAHDHPVSFAKVMIGVYDDYGSDYTAEMANWYRNFDEAPFNENQTIIKLNALLMFVSFKTYFVHILFFCFFSLVGWVLITNSAFSFTDSRNSILALPVLLLPSVLFWTSGVMKEPLLVLGLGLITRGISDFKKWNFLVYLTLGFIIILLTKFFVLACLLPAVLAFLLFRKNESSKFILLKYVAVNIFVLLVLFNIHSVIPSFHPVQMLVNKQTHSIREAEYFNAGSKIEIPQLTNDALSISQGAATGIWNTLIRPYLWEAKNVMMVAAAAENVFIISFLLMCVSFTRWKNLPHLNLFLFLLTFSLTYFALIGMCTPVLGNLVRYKAPVLPFFMFAFIIMVKPKAVSSSLDFLLRK